MCPIDLVISTEVVDHLYSPRAYIVVAIGGSVEADDLLLNSRITVI